MNVLLEQKVDEQTSELRRAMEEAEAANESKSMFLANISYELRTPLSILLSSIQLINFYLDNNCQLDRGTLKEKINIQRQNCFCLLRLVNNLIDITKIDAGHFLLNYTRCNIVEVVENITMSVVEYSSNKGIELVFDTDIEEKYIYIVIWMQWKESFSTFYPMQ